MNIEKVFIDWKNIYSAAISRGGKKISELDFNFLKEALIKKQCFISMGYEKNEVLGGMLFSIYSDYIFYASSGLSSFSHISQNLLSLTF